MPKLKGRRRFNCYENIRNSNKVERRKLRKSRQPNKDKGKGSGEYDDNADVVFIGSEISTSTFHFFVVDNCWREKVFRELVSMMSDDWGTEFVQTCEMDLPNMNVSKFVGVESRPLRVKNVRGDGNCFFRCLAVLITGVEENYMHLRQAIVNCIRVGDLPASYLSVEEYIGSTGMDEDGVWSSEVEIFTAARMLKTDIYTFTECGGRWKWLRYPQSGILSSAASSEERTIYLVHTNRVHYDVVRVLYHVPFKNYPTTSP